MFTALGKWASFLTWFPQNMNDTMQTNMRGSVQNIYQEIINIRYSLISCLYSFICENAVNGSMKNMSWLFGRRKAKSLKGKFDVSLNRPMPIGLESTLKLNEEGVLPFD